MKKKKGQRDIQQKREKHKFLSPPAAKCVNRRTPEEKKDPKTNKQTNKRRKERRTNKERKRERLRERGKEWELKLLKLGFKKEGKEEKS